MAELGELDRCAKLYLVENLSEPWIGEFGPPPAKGHNQLVQQMRRYPTSEQAHPDLLQALQHEFPVGIGLASVFTVTADFLYRQYAVEHIDRAYSTLRRRLGASRQFGCEPSF